MNSIILELLDLQNIIVLYFFQDHKKEEKKDEISLEELIEKERAALSSGTLTKVTLETFVAWKKRKLKEKKDAAIKEEEKKRTDFKAGRQIGVSLIWEIIELYVIRCIISEYKVFSSCSVFRHNLFHFDFHGEGCIVKYREP